MYKFKVWYDFFGNVGEICRHEVITWASSAESALSKVRNAHGDKYNNVECITGGYFV